MAKDNASGGELLDAYVWTDWNVGDIPVSLRYGRQVFNWGESTSSFRVVLTRPTQLMWVQYGLQGPNSGRLSFRLRPFYASAGITESLTIQGYLQFDWEPTQIDDCGTFFSTSDFVADGCGPVYGLGQVTERVADENFGAVIEREGDRRPDGDDQFGVALQWYSRSWVKPSSGFITFAITAVCPTSVGA